MNTSIIPKRSTPHRFAGCALYRALLRSARRVPVVPERQKALGRFIRRSFRRNKDVHSIDLLTQGFRAGYEAHDLLRASASGDSASTERILGLLGTLSPVKPRRSSHVNSSTSASKTPRATPAPKRDGPEPAAKRPSILDRPYLKVPGRRRVPHLCAAHTIPFLRYKKPQPAFLSAVLTYKIKRKARWFRYEERLEGDVESAKVEDDWEAWVEAALGGDRAKSPKFNRAGRTKEVAMEASYEAPYNAAINWLQRRKWQDADANIRMSKRMTEIVWKEEELAEKERIEKKKRKNDERWKRQRERWRRQRMERQEQRQRVSKENLGQEASVEKPSVEDTAASGSSSGA